MPPLIAVSPNRRPDDYLQAIRRAGAMPHLLHTTRDSASEVLARVDGVLLTGGGDVDPARYGESAHPTIDLAAPGRDQLELELVTQALATGVPVLAICRGLQVLNVAAGGTLIQHIPSQVAGALNHDVPLPRDAPAHDVRIEPGSRLASLVPHPPRPSELGVNSRHHQAVGRLGSGLVVTAVAPDGIIEGVETPGPEFCVAVQWHPENFWNSGRFDALFSGFVAACRASSSRARGQQP